jgi:hypothetical protein
LNYLNSPQLLLFCYFAVMHYLPLSDNAVRQVSDSLTVFAEFERVKAQVRPYAGSMYWKREGEYEYLVKTKPRRRTQERLGARSEKTEQIFADFMQRKQSLEQRSSSLREALTEAERLNKAVKAGRVPTLVVTLLNTLEDTGLSPHFTVVGTHALYAYETAASVRIVSGALATQDVDLLWDARRRAVHDRYRTSGRVDAWRAQACRPHFRAQAGPQRNGHQRQGVRS